MGLLGVDPSKFRAFAPEATAESDQLWQTVASGGLAVSFEQSRDGGLPLGAVVPAGRSTDPGRCASAPTPRWASATSTPSCPASRPARWACRTGGLVISAPKADAAKLAQRLKKILPRGTKVAALAARTSGGSGTSAKPRDARR